MIKIRFGGMIGKLSGAVKGLVAGVAGIFAGRTIAKGLSVLADLSDVDFYVAMHLNDLVPEYFSDTMVGLRVKYTLDYQLEGLATALFDYTNISVFDVLAEIGPDGNLESRAEDVTLVLVEDFLNLIEDN